MGCRTCCCFSPRTGARIVGIINLIAGVVGIGLAGYLLVEVPHKDDKEVQVQVIPTSVAAGDDGSNYGFWLLAMVLIFPSVLNILVGMTTLIAVSMNNISVGRLAYVLSIVLTLGSIVLYVTCFILGYHWLQPLPLLLWGILQILFTCALQDFIRLELSIESV